MSSSEMHPIPGKFGNFSRSVRQHFEETTRDIRDYDSVQCSSMFKRLHLGPVLVVDDHPIIAKACRLILGDTETIVAARSMASGYEAFLAHRPDVVILDLSLHGNCLDGIVLIRRICMDAPLARILVFSMHANPVVVTSALEAGASGYLIKDSCPDELPRAVRQVRSGFRYVDERIIGAQAQIGDLPCRGNSDACGSGNDHSKAGVQS